MKPYRDTMIIGIDHGYGNVKTASCCFPTGISAFDYEPVSGLLQAAPQPVDGPAVFSEDDLTVLDFVNSF